LFHSFAGDAAPAVKHQVHAVFQNALRSLLAAEFPGTPALPEVYAIAGGRNDMAQHAQDGKRAVFELFRPPSHVPQEIRLLERADAHWKVPVLIEEQIKQDLATKFFRKRLEGLPFLWLNRRAAVIPNRSSCVYGRAWLDRSARLKRLSMKNESRSESFAI
jgi:hypothetical protein